MTKTVQCEITSLSPLLMNAFPLVPLEAADKKSAEVQAEHAAYRNPKTKELYVPAVAIQRALIGGASYSKGKGRASLVKPAAACLLVSSGEYVGLGVNKYVIDSRAVVIPATKGRVIRHRPRFDEWHLSFELQFDDSLLSEVQVRQIVDDTGKNVGLLDFRPEKKGPFGRFVVTAWKVTK